MAPTERPASTGEGDLHENDEEEQESPLSLEESLPDDLPLVVDSAPILADPLWPLDTDEYRVGKWADVPNYECKLQRNGAPCEYSTVMWDHIIDHITDPGYPHGDGLLRDGFGNLIGGQ